MKLHKLLIRVEASSREAESKGLGKAILKSHSLRVWNDTTSVDFLPLGCELGHLVFGQNM